MGKFSDLPIFRSLLCSNGHTNAGDDIEAFHYWDHEFLFIIGRDSVDKCRKGVTNIDFHNICFNEVIFEGSCF